MKEFYSHGEYEVRWNEIWDDIFHMNTQEDVAGIHPTHFCSTCHRVLTTYFENPSYSSELTPYHYESHISPCKNCKICQQHLQSKKGTKGTGGRPKKKKRVKRRPPPQPSPTLNLARQIFKLKTSNKSSPITPSHHNHNPSTPHNYTHTHTHQITDTPCTSKQPESRTHQDTPRVRRGRGPGKDKTPISQLSTAKARKRRAQPLIDLFDLECKRLREDRDEMKEYLGEFWNPNTGADQKSPEFCLAWQVTTGLTDKGYKKSCNLLEGLQPLSQVKEVEKKLWPGSSLFTLKSPKPCFPDHTHLPLRERIAPIDIMSALPRDPIAHRPKVMGNRFRYDKAVAQTLHEHEELVTQAIDELKGQGITIPEDLEVVFKDGSDGLGDLDVKKARGEELTSDHALRYCYTLLEIFFVDSISGEKHIIYREKKPNSQFASHTILCASANEGDTISSAVCILPIEMEKGALHGNTMTVGKYTYKLKIWSTMYDEKLERHYSGLPIAASNYGCTLCYYHKANDLNMYGSQKITRSFEDSLAKSLMREENEQHLTKEKLEQDCKGVKAKPYVRCTSILDATHADINVSGTFLKKVYIREIAEVYEWNETAAIKEKLAIGEDKLYISLREHIGTVKKLMQGGNYGRDLIHPQIDTMLAEVIPSVNRLKVVRRLLKYYRKLHKVFRSNYPRDDCPGDLAMYDRNARLMGKHLQKHFKYIKKWPNYVHKVLCHVPELIELYGSIGALSTEGSERMNKEHRRNRKEHSRQTTIHEQRDNLRWSWLTASLKLRKDVEITHAEYLCTNCHEPGHNIRTCKATT